jgi:hypothetical protein
MLILFALLMQYKFALLESIILVPLERDVGKHDQAICCISSACSLSYFHLQIMRFLGFQ